MLWTPRASVLIGKVFPVQSTQRDCEIIDEKEGEIKSICRIFLFTDRSFFLRFRAYIAGCSKTLRYKAPEIPRSETYTLVRRNDEG